VEDPARVDVRLDDLAPEVGQTDDSMGGLGRGELLDVNARDSARLGEPQHLGQNERVMRQELVPVGAVPKVADARGVRKQGRERGRVDGQIDAGVLEFSEPLTRVA
jgi:hypothetical protein